MVTTYEFITEALCMEIKNLINIKSFVGNGCFIMGFTMIVLMADEKLMKTI